LNRGFGAFGRGHGGGGRRKAARYGGRQFFGPPPGFDRRRRAGTEPKPAEDTEAPTDPVPSKAPQVALIEVERCNGCGVCVEACPDAALCIKDAKALVDFDACTGCGSCVPPCPEEAIALGPCPSAQA